MKKRGMFFAIFIVFLLILIPNVYSIYEEEVYSGTVEDGDVIEVEGSLFEFRIDSVGNKVYIEIDASALIVASGECEIENKWDICIGNINFSYRNYTEWYDIYKAVINIYQIKSTVSITSTIEKNKLLIDEETTAELTIENTADIAAEDVKATINIPSSIFVTETEGCKKTFDSVIFNADVNPRQVRKCIYKLKGLTADNFGLTANVTYFDGVEQKSATSDTLNVKIYNHSLKISSELNNKSKFDIREKFNLTIDIENINDQYDLYISTFNIKIPEKLLVVKRPGDTTGTNRIITWSGTLAPNENKNFTIELQTGVTGKYSILTEASYKISKFSRTAKNTTTIEVYCDCPYLSHEFSMQITEPGQRVGLKAFITNSNLIHDFRNVQIKYATNIPDIQDFSIVHSRIKPLETIKIFDSSIIVPDLDEVYHLNITSIYEFSTNEVFVVKDNIIIKVPSAEEEIKVEDKEKDVGQEEAEEQEEIEEVDLGTEKIEEETNKSVEKDIGKEETPVTTIADDKETPIKAYISIASTMGVIFLFIILIMFKRRKAEEERSNVVKPPQQILR